MQIMLEIVRKMGKRARAVGMRNRGTGEDEGEGGGEMEQGSMRWLG